MVEERIEDQVEHRPWPLPAGPWMISQVWIDLLFAHWRVPAGVLREIVPEPLMVEEFDGTGWVGLTPFVLTDLRARYLPAVPGLSEFPEMNLRTYVRFEDRPGIWFFSLDAANRLAVVGARAGYRLPYFPAEMRAERREGWIEYESRRHGSGARFEGRYRPVGERFEAVRGSLEYFLAERYALYSVLRNGKVLRGQIHHPPWPLQPAEAEIRTNTVGAAHGVELGRRPDLLHFAARQPTLVWSPELLG